MDLVNYDTPLTNYGSSCPNSPGPCYCTGKCTINEVYGVDMQRHAYPVTKPIGAAHAAKIAEIQDRNPAIGSAESTSRFRKQQAAAQPVTTSSFVEDHNAEEAAEVQAIIVTAKYNSQFAPLKEVLTGLEDILRYKNKKYGGTGLSNTGTFSKAPALEKLLARADDKIARIKNSPELQKNDVIDLAGYLVLICANQGWNNFSEFQD